MTPARDPSERSSVGMAVMRGRTVPRKRIKLLAAPTISHASRAGAGGRSVRPLRPVRPAAADHASPPHAEAEGRSGRAPNTALSAVSQATPRDLLEHRPGPRLPHARRAASGAGASAVPRVDPEAEGRA